MASPSGYSITISGLGSIGIGNNNLTLVADAIFNFAFSKNYNPLGVVESVDYVMTIEGRVVDSPAAAVAADFFALAAQVTAQVYPVDVVISLAGTPVFNMKQVTAFVGPHVTEFASLPDDGNADSHWRYRMTIEAKMQPPQSQNSTYEFTTIFKRTKNNLRTIREVWEVTAKAKTYLDAHSAVMAFAPYDNGIVEDVSDSKTEASCRGVWVWEALQETECHVNIMGSNDYEEVGQPQGNPQLFKKFSKAYKVRIHGKVRGYNPTLTPPGPHLEENGSTIVRLSAMENQQGTTPEIEIENDKKGIYCLPFEEVWMVTDETPRPIHDNDHHLISLDSGNYRAPAPGAILQ
jgi:hypothetical protein